METISGVSSWKLTVRREAEHVEILRAVTCQEKAVLPDRLFGLPVTVLGDHALSPTASQIEGEEVLVTCGPLGEDPGWDNHRLRDLTMPRHLKQVGDYALLNCDALETLRLWDDVRRWSGGTLMNCRSLHAFHLTRTSPEQGETLAYFNDELSRELDVTIVDWEGQTIRLLFPDNSKSFHPVGSRSRHLIVRTDLWQQTRQPITDGRLVFHDHDLHMYHPLLLV